MQQRKLAVERTITATRQRFEVRVWDESQQQLLASPAVPEIELDRGALFVGGRPILEPKLDGNIMSWLQIATDHFCAGMLQFTEDRLAFTGFVSIGPDESSAESHPVAGVVPPSVYTSKVATEGYDEGKTPPPAKDWDPGVTVTLGYEFSKIDHQVQLIFTVEGLDCVEEGIVGLTRDDKGNLRATILWTDDVPSYFDANPLWPANGQLTFSWDAEGFTGWIRKYDPKTPERLSAKRFEWVGQLQEAPELLKRPAARMAASSVTLRAAAALSLEELKSLFPENLDTILNDQLVENMKWAMDDNLRVTFFGQVKPDLSENRLKVVKQDEAFYRDKFAVAYLSWGLNQSEGAARPTNPFNAQEKRRLNYFLHHGLASEAGYNRQSNAMFRNAFATAIPRLSAYIADGGTAWAKKLYDHLILPKNINLVVGQVQADMGKTEAPQRFCNLLWALSPESEYPKLYYNRVMSGVFGFAIEDIDFTKETEDHIVGWAKDWIEKFILQNKDKPQSETAANMARWKLAVELDEARTKAGNAEQLARAMAQAMIAASPGRNLWEKTILAERWLVDKYPAFGKILGRTVRLFSLSYGVYTVVGSYSRWEDMDLKQRIALVTQTVSLARDLIMQIPGIVSETADLMAWAAARRAIRSNPEMGVAAGMEAAAAGREPWIQRASRNFNEWVKDAKAARNSFGRFFRSITRLVQIAGVMISAVYTAISVWNLVDLIRNGGTVTDIALNSVIAAASLVETVTLLFSLFITSSVLTIIGAVAALIGLVIALVQMFRPRDTPPSPVDQFIDGKSRSLIRSLPDPPADWNPPQMSQLFAIAALA
jgi:hypothetical protein